MVVLSTNPLGNLKEERQAEKKKKRRGGRQVGREGGGGRGGGGEDEGEDGEQAVWGVLTSYVAVILKGRCSTGQAQTLSFSTSWPYLMVFGIMGP